jgi:hypothetical protein
MLDGVEIGTGRELEQRVVVLLSALLLQLRKRLLAWQRSDPSPLVFHFRGAWMIDLNAISFYAPARKGRMRMRDAD